MVSVAVMPRPDHHRRNTMYRHIALAAVLTIAAPAHAGELVRNGAESIELGSFRGIAYYTEADGIYSVVTTLAEGEAGLPVRFETTLADNQKLIISVPGMFGETGKVIEISRTGDRLVASHPKPAVDAVAASTPHLTGN
jgi:hypothetical protein